MPHHHHGGGGYHHGHGHHHGGGGLGLGLAIGAVAGAAMRPPPRRSYYQPQPTVIYTQQPVYAPPPVVRVVQSPSVYQQPQIVLNHSPPFQLTGCSVPSFEQRGNAIFYQIVISSSDLGPNRPWSVWRRYKQFEELKDSCSIHANFPAKDGIFGLFSGPKSQNELEARRVELEAWLREVISLATMAGRIRLQNLVNVFVDFRRREYLAPAALVAAPAGGQQPAYTNNNSNNGNGNGNGGNVVNPPTMAPSTNNPPPVAPTYTDHSQPQQQQPIMAVAVASNNSPPAYAPSSTDKVNAIMDQY